MWGAGAVPAGSVGWRRRGAEASQNVGGAPRLIGNRTKRNGAMN